MIEERVAGIVEGVAADVLGQLEALEQEAVSYAKRYAEWVVLKDTLNPPQAPRALHPMGGKMVRELVLDRAACPW